MKIVDLVSGVGQDRCPDVRWRFIWLETGSRHVRMIVGRINVKEVVIVLMTVFHLSMEIVDLMSGVGQDGCTDVRWLTLLETGSHCVGIVMGRIIVKEVVIVLNDNSYSHCWMTTFVIVIGRIIDVKVVIILNDNSYSHCWMTTFVIIAERIIVINVVIVLNDKL